MNVGAELMKDNHGKEIFSSVYAWMDAQIETQVRHTDRWTDEHTQVYMYVCMKVCTYRQTDSYTYVCYVQTYVRMYCTYALQSDFSKKISPPNQTFSQNTRIRVHEINIHMYMYCIYTITNHPQSPTTLS